jgi:hypothetical protein
MIDDTNKRQPGSYQLVRRLVTRNALALSHWPIFGWHRKAEILTKAATVGERLPSDLVFTN